MTCESATETAHRLHDGEPVQAAEREAWEAHRATCDACDQLALDLEALPGLLAEAFVAPLTAGQEAAFALRLRGEEKSQTWEEAGALAARWVRAVAVAAAVLAISATLALTSDSGLADAVAPGTFADASAASGSAGGSADAAIGETALARETEAALEVDTGAFVFGDTELGDTEAYTLAAAELALGADVQWGDGQ